MYNLLNPTLLSYLLEIKFNISGLLLSHVEFEVNWVVRLKSLKGCDTTLHYFRARFALSHCTVSSRSCHQSVAQSFIQPQTPTLISIMFFTWWLIALCVTSSCKSLLIRKMEQPPPISLSLSLSHTHDTLVPRKTRQIGALVCSGSSPACQISTGWSQPLLSQLDPQLWPLAPSR